MYLIDFLIYSNSNSITKSFSKSSRPFLKVKGELGLEDLPPIEDLKISVPHQDCEVIGSVYNIVDKLGMFYFFHLTKYELDHV